MVLSQKKYVFFISIIESIVSGPVCKYIYYVVKETLKFDEFNYQHIEYIEYT